MYTTGRRNIPHFFGPFASASTLHQTKNETAVFFLPLHRAEHSFTLFFFLHHTHTQSHTLMHSQGAPVSDWPVGGAVYPDRRRRCATAATVASQLQLILLRKDLRSAALSLTYFNIFTTLLLPRLTFIRCLQPRSDSLLVSSHTAIPCLTPLIL